MESSGANTKKIDHDSSIDDNAEEWLEFLRGVVRKHRLYTLIEDSFDDIVNDAYIDCQKAETSPLRKKEPIRNKKEFFRRIAKTKIYFYARKIYADKENIAPEGISASIPDANPNPEVKAIENDLVSKLYECREYLTKKRRVIFDLWMEGLTKAEIARKLGRAESTVGEHIEKIIKVIREKLHGLR